jgi:hypothetical protein
MDGGELCSVCEEYIAEWFCRKCDRKICQVHPLSVPPTKYFRVKRDVDLLSASKKETGTRVYAHCLGAY